MKHALIVLAALALGACASYPDRPIVGAAPIRSDGLAMIGQPTRVGALVVTPIALKDDSRCPINVRCVWAGRVVVETRIDGAGWRETTDMELGRPYITHSVGLQLSSAEPNKVAGAPPVPAAAYTFGYEGGR